MRVPSGWGYDFSIARASTMGSVARKILPNLYTRFGACGKVFLPGRKFTFLLLRVLGGFTILVSGCEVLIRKNRKCLGQSIRHFGEMPQFSNQFRRKLPGSEPPLPISSVQAGRVHAGLTAQSEHVLHRDQGKLGHRSLRRANKRPMDPILAGSKIGLRV